jgi:transposase
VNIQQYKYRKNFPFNDTIEEDSEEELSCNKSSNTFNSMKPKRNLMAQVMGRQVQKIGGMQGKGETLQEVETFPGFENDNFYNIKSENLIRNFKEEVTRNDVQENDGFYEKKVMKVSKRYIKSNEDLDDKEHNVSFEYMNYFINQSYRI